MTSEKFCALAENFTQFRRQFGRNAGAPTRNDTSVAAPPLRDKLRKQRAGGRPDSGRCARRVFSLASVSLTNIPWGNPPVAELALRASSVK